MPKLTWLEDPHLAFSHICQGFFCIPCVFFSTSSAAELFVKKAHTKYWRTQEDWLNHKKSNYHQEMVMRQESFLLNMQKGTTVHQLINKGAKAEIEKNRKMIKGCLRF
jgi:hypothetical protein